MNNPRRLTNDEINYILNKIPPYVSGTINREAAKFAYKNLLKFEKFRLRQIVITPLAIEEYREKYTISHTFSNVEYGTPVGGTSAEAFSRSSSQQAMDSFKIEVAKVSTNSVEAFDEILEARYRKVPIMFVYYNDKPTIEEIYNKKRLILETISVKDLIITERVETVDELYPNGTFPDWYDIFRAVMVQTDIPKFNWIYQIRINTDLMFKNKILPRDIARSIESEGILKCIYSPLLKDESGSYIIMDVYVSNKSGIMDIKEYKESKLGEEDNIFMYLYNTFMPKVSTTNIRGLNKISSIRKIIIPINFSLYSETNLSIYYPEKKNEYLIKLNIPYMTLNFITINNIINMFKSLEINDVFKIDEMPELKDFDDMDLYVKLPPEPKEYTEHMNKQKKEDKMEYTPINYISFIVKVDKKEVDDYRISQKKIKSEMISNSNKLLLEGDKIGSRDIRNKSANIKIYKEPSIPYMNCNQIYIETSGSDISNLIKMDDIDMTRSYSNNLYEILKYFGIEAVRSHIIKELIHLIKSTDSYIDLRHITLIADWMTMFGYITPFTLKGMKSHELGSLANAALREPTKALQEESILNRTDYLNNISSAMTVGNPVKIGTGLVNLIVDEDKIRRILAKKPKEEKISLDVTSRLVSLLLEGDFLDPKNDVNRLLPQKEMEPYIDIPITFARETVIQHPDEVDIEYSLNSLFPIVSDELRFASNNSSVCSPAKIDTIVTEVDVPSDKPSNEISSVIMPSIENMGIAQQIERPPEIEKLDIDTSFLDDLLI